ncbi:type III-A CRISPR-associated RAMP protein Csm4 [Methanobrevibacter olleyae]|uniref:CRISPR system Cms protein Csm4 n=1 Tax=Methanobrevibacter olleyae TaxID=294671 RepID=A0A126QYY3_METOL|nr:type III-A CRISPR-associated RAMP protein Csm4 [Methanobrevibacter olleyae]AMK15251.1 CRISPR-associated RAMP protein Csm4 family [Methanobrevibacter olleyae]
MLVYLKPLSIFPQLHSDTLFGAITYAINELYPEKITDMLEAFKDNPPFILSSTLPFIFNKDKIIRFYPKVITKQSNEESRIIVDSKIFKDYKKVSYLEEDIFLKMIKGELSEKEILSDYANYERKKTLLLNEKLDIDVSFGENIIPNNSVNRVSNETEGIFYTNGIEFKNIGLFFFVDFNDEEYIPLVKAALKFLEDRGFGRDITNGKGQFVHEIEGYISFENIFNIGDDFDYFLTLSRYIPNNEELSKINEYSSYEIDSKRGKSPAGEIRRQIRFFKEGSIFPNYKKFYGRIIESGKDSPAVEYGYAFPIKCKGNRED